MKTKMIIKDQKGATAVEFAIILPVLFLILFGIIEFSLLLYDKAMLTNACREGARAGVVFSWPSRIDKDRISKVVDDYCKQHLITFGESTYKINFDPEDEDPPCIQGESITIRVEYRYNFLVLPNFVNDLIGGIPLNVESVMRCE